MCGYIQATANEVRISNNNFTRASFNIFNQDTRLWTFSRAVFAQNNSLQNFLHPFSDPCSADAYFCNLTRNNLTHLSPGVSGLLAAKHNPHLMVNPNSLILGFPHIFYNDKHFHCPTVRCIVRSNVYEVQIDPHSFNYTKCSCNSRYFGVPPDHCNECASNYTGMKCEHGAESAYETNYWPEYDDGGMLLGVVECDLKLSPKFPCNPTGYCMVNYLNDRYLLFLIF